MSESTALKLSWQPELEDYVEAFRARNKLRRAPKIVSVIAVVLLVVALVGLVAGRTELVIVGIGWAACLGFNAGPGVYFGVRSMWRRSPNMRLPVQMSIDPAEGLLSSIPGSTGQWDWSCWDGFLETQRTFVLHAGRRKGGQFLVVAKRGLTSPDEVATLRDMLSRVTGEAMRSAKPVGRGGSESPGQ